MVGNFLNNSNNIKIRMNATKQKIHKNWVWCTLIPIYNRERHLEMPVHCIALQCIVYVNACRIIESNVEVERARETKRPMHTQNAPEKKKKTNWVSCSFSVAGVVSVEAALAVAVYLLLLLLLLHIITIAFELHETIYYTYRVSMNKYVVLHLQRARSRFHWQKSIGIYRCACSMFVHAHTYSLFWHTAHTHHAPCSATSWT